jgi:hypothetical protein
MIQNLPINNDNFLRFYENVAPSLDQSKYYNGLVNGYEYRWRNIDIPLPIIVGDTLHFYTNFETSIFDDLTQSVVILEGSSVIEDVTKYVISATQIGLENWLITLTIPQTNTAQKVFNIGIKNDNDNVVTHKSNCFRVLNKTEKNLNATHLLSFRHPINVFNYEWGSLDITDPDYIVRVPSNILEFSYPKEDAVYKSATSGKPRKTRTILSKAYQFETYYLDEKAHDAVNLAVNLEKFLINGDEFIADGAYEVEFQQLTNIHKGTINLLLKRYGARLNNCVTPPPPPTPPSINYLLIENTEGVYLDSNIRLIKNEAEIIIEQFSDGANGSVVVENNDLIRVQYFFLAGLYDPSVTSGDLEVIVLENSGEIINVRTPIPNLEADFTLNEEFTAFNDSVYDITVRSIVTGTV